MRSHGFLYDRARYGDDRWVPVRDVELRTDYDDDGTTAPSTPRWPPTTTATRSRATCGRTSRCATAAPPPRRAADDAHQRGHDDVAAATGTTGAGLAEYLDQLVDGVAVGRRDGF